MPSPLRNNPEVLESYYCHGLDLESHGEEYSCECAFCGEPKFSVNARTGLFQCWACQAKGNPETFIEQLWDAFDKTTTDYSRIAGMRGLEVETVMQWGLVWSPLRRMWMLPGYNVKGEVRNLYRYGLVNGKMRLLATKGMPHALYGVNLYDKSKPNVFLCESWDALSLWEVLRQSRWTDDGPKPTAGNDNLLGDSNVLGLPGTSGFRQQWSQLFAGKIVFLCFDNDHPRVNKKTGAIVPSAGMEGAKRIAGILGGGKQPPSEIRYLHWNPSGEEYYSNELPHGFDVTDALRIW